MDLSLVSDTFTIATKQTLGGSTRSASEFLKISAAFSALAPSRVRPTRNSISCTTTLSRSLLRKKRRTRKINESGGDEHGGFLDGDGGDDFNGPTGGGGYGGGGSGNWNSDGFSGNNWNNDDLSSNSWSRRAFYFVYEVISWIALSNCVHFAFKKIVRTLADRWRKNAVRSTLTHLC